MALEERGGDAVWVGLDFLATIEGNSDRFPPLRVLFLAWRIRGDGRLSVQTHTGKQELFLQQGQIVSARGFPDLLTDIGVPGSPWDDLGVLVSRAVGAGQRPEDALAAGSRGLGRAFVAWVGNTRAQVSFDTRAAPPPLRLPLADPLPRIIGDGLRAVRPADKVRAALTSRLREPIRLELPDDAPETRWGLDALSFRLLREAQRCKTLGDLVGTASPGEPVWTTVDLLVQLGLVQIGAPPAAVRAPAVPLPRAAPTPPAAPPAAKPSLPRPVPTAPAARPAPPMEEEATRVLRESLAALEAASAPEVLGLTRARDLTDEAIERAFRAQSARFHPDRYGTASKEARELASRCFTRVNEAWQQLKEPAFRTEFVNRLKAKEAGKHYVGESDQRRARIAFIQGEQLARARRWEEAYAFLEEAASVEPTNWRYAFVKYDAAYYAGKATADATDAALRTIAVMGAPEGAARADVLAAAGEILLREGKEELAYTRFREAIEAFPEHVGAKRRLWLQQRRKDEPSVGGMLDSLMRKRK